MFDDASILLYFAAFCVGIVVLWLVLVYLVRPLWAWRAFSVQVHPEIVVFDPATTEMPPDVRTYFALQHDALLDMGFEYLLTLSVPRYTTHDIGVFAVYRNREKLMSASVAAHHARVKEKLQPARCYLTFSSEFIDGDSMGTTNLPLLVMLNSRKRPSQQFVDVPSAERLLAIHEGRVRQANRPLCGPDRFVEWERDPLGEFRETFEDGLRSLAEQGMLQLSPDGQAYQLTLGGSYRFIWSHLPPWSRRRWKQILREGHRTIAELERQGLLTYNRSPAAV
jgi:hypothetical protein